MSRGWFEVDRAGLAAIAKRRGVSFIITEPIQNAWDEASTEAHVTLTPVPGRPRADIEVRDDSPDGFRDLADSFMMFRTSYKLANPEQRGRFNIGEKLLLAVADEARITSTTGSVIFGPKGRTAGRKRTEAGSILTARIAMTREELAEALKMASTLIPPPGVRTYINGTLLPIREPLAESERTLDTETQGAEGGFSYTRRKTTVRVYPVLEGEEPHLYEMGIPIDKVPGPWHVEVMQKVPLSVDRSSVRYGYTQALGTAAAEMMAQLMSEEDSRGAWVTDALTSMDDDEAVREVISKRFGDKVVTFDPSSPESNKLALDAGFTVVKGGEFPARAWQTIRRAEALKPAGQMFPSGKVKTSPNGVPPIPDGEWDEDMRGFARVAEHFAEYVLDGKAYRVMFWDDPLLEFNGVCMAGPGILGFNLGGELRGWVRNRWAYREELMALLIHECAHDAVEDHLTHAFHRECCRIGAKAWCVTWD